MTETEFSIVVPLFNEQDVVEELCRELLAVCDATGKEYEIIFVDDGSTDNTFAALNALAQNDSRFKVLRLSRNFGHQAAINAGIDYAKGRSVITMDGDLQHPPSMIPVFLEQADGGADIVLAQRTSKKEAASWIRRSTSELFYWLFGKVTNLEFKPNVSDFGLFSQPVISVLKQLPERDRYLRGIVQWVGFKKTYVPYTADARRAGKSKYTLRKQTELGLSAVTSFSASPLRWAFWFGTVSLIVSFLFAIYVVYDHFFNPNPWVTGLATVAIILLTLGSLQLMILGITGEYLYKMFNELKGRPLYIVREAKNIEKGATPKTPYGI
ncbi:MAG TPA: glycosyltransferase family 2 protein [Acidobacteriota bacterium]|nr:glycosyltransferase family 2 protein [Acidobacteriota bacterium]